MSTRTSLRDASRAGVAPVSEDPARPPDAPGAAGGGEVGQDLEEHLVSLLSPQSFEADQYRILRHFLDPGKGAETRQVLAVTSPAAGDGKTTTAVNLAATLAQLPGARVLLMDTDLRRPFVATSLGLDESSGPGLGGTALDLALELDELVRPTPFNFDIVPAGPPPPNAYQVFDSPRVGELLEEARRAYDHVVLDTPPVLLVPDCRLMSQWVDGFVIVVAANRTPRRLLADALSALDQDKVLGIVFNADLRPLSGYYKNYSGYYGYHQNQSANGRRSWWRFPWGRGKRGGRTQWR
jgi:capsular exopolysaccharide synthesis family protein